MKPLYRFMILALVGFGVGAGVATFQATRKLQEEPAAVVAGADEAVVTDLPTAVAVESAAEAALNRGSQDLVNAPEAQDGGAVASADMPADTADSHESHADHLAPIEEHSAHDHAGHETAATERPTPDAAAVSAAVAGSSVGGAFTLTDHNAQAVTDKSWPGKYTLVFFGFTHCPDICPAALDKMTAALDTLGADAQGVQPLFITIDPARDDAATMKTYLENYHASILGLTGTEAQIKQAEDGYKVYAAKVDGADPVNYTMAHSSYVFLMSPEGELLEIFRDADPADDMAARIRARITP